MIRRYRPIDEEESSRMTRSVSRFAAIAAMAIATAVAPMSVRAQESAEGWKFSLMPYFWLPTIETNLNFGPVVASRVESEISVAPSDWLPKMKMAGLLAGEARYGKWLLAGDYVYLNLGSNNSHTNTNNFGPGQVRIVDTGSDTSLKTTIWSIVGGYSVVSAPAASVDVIAGVRYLSLKATTDWNLNVDVTGPNGNSVILPRSGSVGKSANVTSAIVGAKGRVKLGETNWFVPFYVDVGGGNSVTTWQAAAGIGYAYPWGDVRLDYRYLSFDQDGDKLIKDLNMGGAALGVNFVF
jgi:hypothetical protein